MCRVDSQTFYWRLHFVHQIIAFAPCLQKTGGFARNWPPAHAKFACDWRPVAYKLYPSGRQSHATCIKSAEICMRLAATQVQFTCNWRPLRYNLHATGGHSVSRQETSRQEVRKRPSLYIIIIFFSIGKSTSSTMLLTIQLTALGYLVWKMRWYYGDKATWKQILHALASSCVQSCQFFASTLRLYENNYFNTKK